MIATLDHYAETQFTLHAYVVMPDHLHLLITPTTTIEKPVQMIKGGFSFRAKRDLAWKSSIWQQGFTDHRIRDEEDWRRHLEYTRQNPVRAGLAPEAVLYPYMNFPHQSFPQRLKPTTTIGGDVRAEARTLQRETALRGKLGTSPAKDEDQTGPRNAAMKGTGFSPSAKDDSRDRALVPEGRQP